MVGIIDIKKDGGIDVNRAERRRNNIIEPPKTYTINDEHLAAIKKQVKDEAIDVAFSLMIGLPVLVLRDNEKWGELRLNRFIDQIKELFEEFQEGRLTLEDIHKKLKDETGVEIIKT